MIQNARRTFARALNTRHRPFRGTVTETGFRWRSGRGGSLEGEFIYEYVGTTLFTRRFGQQTNRPRRRRGRGEGRAPVAISSESCASYRDNSSNKFPAARIIALRIAHADYLWPRLFPASR